MYVPYYYYYKGGGLWPPGGLIIAGLRLYRPLSTTPGDERFYDSGKPRGLCVAVHLSVSMDWIKCNRTPSLMLPAVSV